MFAELRSLCAVCGVVLLALLLGYAVGRLTTMELSIPDIPLVVQEDERATVPVVRIDGVRNGELSGAIEGEVRVFFGEEAVVPNASGGFLFPVSLCQKEEVIVDVPPSAKFVASKRGKKYYPVSSREGEKLVLKNRLYFGSAEEAERAGFEKWKE